jgi:hypothetical protein
MAVDTTRAHGVVAMRTADGPIYLWAAPTRDGGTCWLLQFIKHKNSPNEPLGPNGCRGSAPARRSIQWWGILPSPSVWGGRVGTSPSAFGILIGQAFGDASYVTVASSQHALLKVPVVEHFFLAVVAPEATPHKITSYDQHGRRLAESDHQSF